MDAFSLRDFILSYPYPAFILPGKPKEGRNGSSLKPSFTNAAFRRLLTGADAASDTDTASAWIAGLRSAERSRDISFWLFSDDVGDNGESIPLNVALTPIWAPVDHPVVTLKLVKTPCRGEYWAITSIPLTPLPYHPVPALPTPTTTQKRPALHNSRLPDFPTPNALAQPSGLPTLKTIHASSPPLTILSDSRIDDKEAEMRCLLDDFRWETTPLGHRKSWSQSLKSMVGVMMANPHPAALWWGPELTFLYNAAYIGVAGSKHPWMFGQAGSVAWGELWEGIGPASKIVLNGTAVAKQDDLLFFDRLTERQLPEEVYHSWSWIPVPAEGNVIGGLYNTTFETTDKVLAERRMRCLRHICERAMLSSSVSVFAQSLLDVFGDVPYEATIAALYLCTAVGGERTRSYSNISDLSSLGREPSLPAKFRVNLTGSIGIHDQSDGHPHPLFPRTFTTACPQNEARPTTSATGDVQGRWDLSEVSLNSSRSTPDESVSWSGTPSTSGSEASTILGDATEHVVRPVFDWSPYIEEAAYKGKAVHVPVLPADLAANLGAGRGWGDLIREALVIPIMAEGDQAEIAMLILNVNTRAAYTESYSSWIDVLRMTLGSALTAVLGREAETRRGDQLAQLDAAKTAFFSNASHELRTPLTLIGGPLNEALKFVNDHRAKDRLSLASRNVSRLSRLVDSLMDFSRIEGGKLTGRFRPVALAPFTADLASLFRSTIEKNNIDYRVECNIEDNTVVYVDPDLWEKIVFNLIGNAFKYTMEGNIVITIRFSPLWASFTVEDTGVGIPHGDIDKSPNSPHSTDINSTKADSPAVFDRFHRVAATSRSQEGTGIGLALTKELVRLHGGQLTVASRAQLESASHGSKFSVFIPKGHKHIPTEHLEVAHSGASEHRIYGRGIVDEASQWGRNPTEVSTPSETSRSESSTGFGSMDSGTLFFAQSDVVMIVDDNSDMRRYIKSLFMHYCTVVDACDGQEALNWMMSSKVRPNVVVTDRMMPNLDGYGLLQAMRSKPELRLIPVVMVTADAGDEARLEGLLSGADDYIPKPFTAKQLVARTHLQMQIGRRNIELEANFESSTTELRVLSELAPVGIFRADTLGHITWTNPTWVELTNHADDSPLDNWVDYVIPDERDTVRSCWQRLCEDLEPQKLVLEFNLTSGRCVQAQFNVLDGSVIGGAPSILGTLTDISERRMLQEAQLQHAEEREMSARHRAEESETRRQEAEERRRAQELLIDVTSHELRQPVSAILNCAALVRSNYRNLRSKMKASLEAKKRFEPTIDLLATMEEDLEALDAIYQCGLSQERIANDVLSLSRMQLEVLSILPVDFALSEEVKRISSLFHNELKMKGISFKLHIGPVTKALGASQIRLDKARFAQIVTNLLSNAIKFTDISPPNNRDIQVFLEVSPQPPIPGTCLPPKLPSPLPWPREGPIYVYMSVKDSGPGLKPTDLALLFQRFAQGSNSHEVFGGSGLGLFVSRKLCDLMSGRIEVESEYGRGATFRFYVEGTISSMPSMPSMPLDAEPLRLGGKPDIDPVIKRSLHILITEDNQINQTILNRQLKAAGCKTSLASNGVEAIDQITKLYANEKSQFDVILMDCEMPVMNGYNAVREIRRMEVEGIFNHRNRILALTGNARSAQVQNAREAGMDDVIIKPYKIDELLRTVDDAVLNLA